MTLATWLFIALSVLVAAVLVTTTIVSYKERRLALDQKLLDLANRLAVVAPRIDAASKSSTPDSKIQPALDAITGIVTQFENDYPVGQ